MTVARQVQSYFDKVATGYQQSSQNPIWGGVRRREQRAFMGLVGDVRGRDVMELGCGAGFYTRLLLSEGASHVHAIDFSQKMLDELPTDGVTPIHGDAAAVDPGRKFAIMVSAGMLEFVPDPVAVLRNAARFADAGATLTILYPTNGLLGRAYRRFHKGHGFAIRLFDERIVRDMAGRTGWTVARVVGAGPYSGCAQLRFGGAA